ncbi:flagellar hook-basal body complex protein FliE [Hydrogenothermus marinus]|uniref:Flagellar hook-basal body complex protein FliE n=1 Tax=Hydrogenothermus marinus TaxID=133270 RepID=A0A3M0BRL9_9AQUI|nr:flagellar hook-basal body complex protein FliE [Hydrogenothermus marinus]RMA97488.1 flagellar hook-basal body complex protein FliE [Hydrogenothermus marinus]
MKINGLGENFLIDNPVKKQEDNSFGKMLENFIADVNNDLKTAKVAKEKILNGEVKNMEQLLYQIEKAGISFTLITEIRNKALESYQEIMRMQV